MVVFLATFLYLISYPMCFYVLHFLTPFELFALLNVL